ncbi:MAG: CHAT domain-containing protein [Pseudomonadota bacterium]
MRGFGLAGPLLLSFCLSAQADRSTEQVAMAAGGRYDQLEKSLEAQLAQGPLDTRDRHALCYAYSKTKRYARLMECLDQLALNLKKGDKRTRLFALDDATPSLGLMRSEAQLELGQYEAAVLSAQRTLEWLAADQSEDLDMVFNALAAEAIALAMNGERDRALQVHTQLMRTSAGMLGPYASAKAFALARTRMALGDYEGVLAALNGDKLFAVNVFLDRLVSGGFLTGVNNWVWAELPRAFMINKALLETGRSADAKAGFDRLLALRQVAENGEIYWLLLGERGQIADREQDRAAALGFYQRAIDVVELQRASINTEASKIGFVGDKQALYGRAIACALALGRPEVAYDLIERAKSRALVDLLAGKGANLALKGQNADSTRLLAKVEEAADAALAQLPLDMTRAGGADNRAVMHSQVQALKLRDPALASLVSVGALTLAQVRAYLRPDEVLVEYYLNGGKLVLMGVSQDKVVSASIDAGGLDAQVRALRAAIEGQQATTLALAKALYTRLLAPAAALIEGKNLVVVPHGSLHYLPFAALHDGTAYLAASHNLRYLPSASVHQYLRPHAAAGVDHMLVFGNPDLGNPQFDLPSAEEEAKMIAATIPDSKILTRLAASETVFKEIAGNYRYLHVAAHGQFKGDTPLQSRLALAADGANDGSLTVSEIYGLRLNADLVTLSACETGLTKAMNGDDLIGMTRGFLYAGSSNIIASLWEVDDEATSELMKQFYLNLKAGQGKKEALRQAQLSLWPRFPNPLYWAAFYLTGQG